jgi:hypothetical protein
MLSGGYLSESVQVKNHGTGAMVIKQFYGADTLLPPDEALRNKE